MRKILFSVIIMLLITGAIFLWMYGLQIGSFKINGAEAIQQLGETLEGKILEAEELVTVSVNKANKDLNTAVDELANKREEYERKVALSTEEEVERASQQETHEIQFLWAKIGNYATKNGLKLTLDFKESSNGVQGEKDLDFTLEGTYTGITNFLYNIENDDDLGFRIEDFALIPIKAITNNGEQVTEFSTLQAKFSVKEKNVDLG